MEEKKKLHKRASGKYPENRLQQVRIKARFAKEDAAELLDCSTRSVQRYEPGKKLPGWDMLDRMHICYVCDG